MDTERVHERLAAADSYYSPRRAILWPRDRQLFYPGWIRPGAVIYVKIGDQARHVTILEIGELAGHTTATYSIPNWDDSEDGTAIGTSFVEDWNETNCAPASENGRVTLLVSGVTNADGEQQLDVECPYCGHFHHYALDAGAGEDQGVFVSLCGIGHRPGLYRLRWDGEVR